MLTGLHAPLLFQELLGRHQRELAERDASLTGARDDLSSLRSQLAHAVAERSIAAAAETRATAALQDAVGDRNRYARLVDSLQVWAGAGVVKGVVAVNALFLLTGAGGRGTEPGDG